MQKYLVSFIKYTQINFSTRMLVLLKNRRRYWRTDFFLKIDTYNRDNSSDNNNSEEDNANPTSDKEVSSPRSENQRYYSA